MAFPPDDFDKLARKLAAPEADEATIRTAIGRLYYAAHLLTRQVLWERRGYSAGTSDAHAKLIREINKGKTQVLAGMLKRLRELRVHCDYHIDSASGPFNPECTLCERVRNKPDSPVVGYSHWEEAFSDGEAFIRRIVTVS